MPKTWRVRDRVPAEVIDNLPNLNALLVQLLYSLGLTDIASAHLFLQPQYERMYSPFKFASMGKAVQRIWQAIDKEEKIVVYGDYDADGITASAVLMQTFRYLGVEVKSYVPDRFTEGYGLNLDAFEKLKTDGANLVITVDCGTNAVDVADWCNENRIDLIITDHHEITGEVPKAFALINPKNLSDSYPDDQITGVVVAYKLAKAILSEKSKVIKSKGIAENEYVENWDKWLLDLVAIGTVADCHSLFGENRIIVTFGLKVLQKTKWIGLRALLDIALGVSRGPLDTYTIGFVLAPRINAAGRLEHANSALNLLLCEDIEKAQELSGTLEQINRRRQDLTARLVSEALEQAELQSDRKILVLAHPDWHRGVVGLVAGKLVSELHKPVIVLEKGEAECTGSARSVGNFDIIQALKSVSEHLTKFGGHKQAAGLTVSIDKLNDFHRALIEYTETHITEADLENTLELEAELTPEDLTLDVFDVIAELEPFGFGNPKPKFLLKNAVIQSKRLVGKDVKHVQLALQVKNVLVESIGFNLAKICEKFGTNDTIDAVVEMLADSFNGQRKFKLRI